MNTDITDNSAINSAGWIFFDAECRFCRAARRRWGRIFECRGFVWLPLQTPGAAEWLGVTPERLMAEMRVLPRGGVPLNGLNEWIGLMRHVWWLKSLAAGLNLPGIRPLGGAVYRFLARHRYCLGGRCRMVPAPAGAHHRHAAFFEFP